jgi:hypothetical protein
MLELDPTKEYTLRAKTGDKYTTMISAKTNDKGSPVIGINPALLDILKDGKWANLYLGVFDKKEQGKPAQSKAPAQADDEPFDSIPF